MKMANPKGLSVWFWQFPMIQKSQIVNFAMIFIRKLFCLYWKNINFSVRKRSLLLTEQESGKLVDQPQIRDLPEERLLSIHTEECDVTGVVAFRGKSRQKLIGEAHTLPVLLPRM